MPLEPLVLAHRRKINSTKNNQKFWGHQILIRIVYGRRGIGAPIYSLGAGEAMFKFYFTFFSTFSISLPFLKKGNPNSLVPIETELPINIAEASGNRNTTTNNKTMTKLKNKPR